MQLDKDFLNREVERMGFHIKPKPRSPYTITLVQT